MSLTNRKLKLWHPTGGTVTVYQDGTTTDVDATTQYDDAFRSGIGSTGLRIELSTLRQGWDEAPELVFSISGRESNGLPGWLFSNQGATRLLPNTLVELWADALDDLDQPNLPAWHLAQQSGQVRIFYGWIETVAVDPGGSRVTATAYGALKKADEIALVRSRDDGIQVPSIYFNPTDLDDPGFYWGIKRKSNTAFDFGTGIPAGLAVDTSGWLMSVGDILEWLESEYGADLAAAGVTASSDIFDAGDLAALTLTPPPTQLDNVGFTTGVRTILRYAPNIRLWHDPRDLRFRLVPFAAGITDGFATIDASVSGATIPVDSTTPFSATTGATGNWVRLQDSDDATKWEIRQVASISAGVSITLTAAPSISFGIGDRVLVLDGAALPTVALDGSSYLLGTAPTVDLQDVYTAVRIQSFTQRKRRQSAIYPGISGVPALAKGWDDAFESAWRAGDENRREDYGAGGSGIPLYGIDITSGAAVTMRIAAEESAFERDHVNDEWIGASVVMFTVNNANTRTREVPYSFTVTDFTVLANIGDGRPGFEIAIAESTTAFNAAVGATVYSEQTGPGASKVADRIGLSTKFTLATTTAENARSRVGRSWIFQDVEAEKRDGGASQISCQLTNVVATACTGDTRISQSGTPHGGTPGDQQGPQWEQISGSGLGQIMAWRRGFQTPRALACPEAGACGGVGYVEPKNIDAEVEITLTTVYEARFPASGYAGMAYQLYGLEREKTIVLDEWLQAGNPTYQVAYFQDLARRKWDILSQPRWTGAVELHGIQSHGALLDLSCRLALLHTMGPSGGGDVLASVWAVPTSVTLDFSRDSVSLSLDNRGAFATLADEVFGDFRLKEKARIAQLRMEQARTRSLAQCAVNANRNPSVSGVCATQVYSQGRPIPPRIVLPDKDNQGTGIGPTTAIGDTFGERYGGTSGYQADRTVIRDVTGGAYQVGPTGAIVAGSISGDTFTASTGAARQIPYSRIDDAQAAAGAALEGFGLTPQYEATYIASEVLEVANGTGVTNITVRHSGLTVDAYIGGTLELLDYRDGVGRIRYAITDNTADTITVATISDHPRVGTGAHIWPPRLPVVDPTDWPNGGFRVKDTAGNWAVVDAVTGELAAATLDGTTLVADTGVTLALRGSHALASGHSATYSGVLGEGGGGGGASVTFSTSAPSSPSTGAFWVDTTA